MINDSEAIKINFLNRFNYPGKGNYDWEVISSKIDSSYGGVEGRVFKGVHKDDENNTLFVKLLKIKNGNYKDILKEIYFLVLLKNNENIFVDLDDILLSNEIIYLIFKKNNTSLRQLIQYKNINYLDNKDLIKWIIYQITKGLEFLHFNNIIHNDIKPDNILVDSKGKIFICDFGSATYKSKKSYEFTAQYAPPEFLNYIIKKEKQNNIIEYNRDHKSDMWSLGVIIVELFTQKNNYFFDENEENLTEKYVNILKNIISKFGITINENFLENDEIDKLINDEVNINYIQLEEENINDEKAINLIKNLLVLNPKKRFNAKQAINSDYLKDFKEFDLIEMKKINNPLLDYNKLTNVENSKEFFENCQILCNVLKNS